MATLLVLFAAAVFGGAAALLELPFPLFLLVLVVAGMTLGHLERQR